MSFTRSTISSPRKSKTAIFKYLTMFFLGATCITLMTNALEINTRLENVVQYIHQIFLTSDGSNSGTTGIILDGSGGNAWFQGDITMNGLTGLAVLGTDASGKFISSTSGTIYNLISGFVLGGSQGNTGATGATGAQGIQGTAGAKGATGATGTFDGTENDPIFMANSGLYYPLAGNDLFNPITGSLYMSNGTGSIDMQIASVMGLGYLPTIIPRGNIMGIGDINMLNVNGSLSINSINTGSATTLLIAGYGYAIGEDMYGWRIQQEYTGSRLRFVPFSGATMAPGVDYIQFLSDGRIQSANDIASKIVDVKDFTTKGYVDSVVGGVMGPQGIQGATGADGAQGIQGATGADGATGFLQAGILGATPYRDGSTWITNNTNIFNTGGNVGIGIDTPTAKLHINGNITSDGFISRGNGVTVSGIDSVAMGDRTHANGENSTAMGHKTYAEGDTSTAMGGNTEARGDLSTAMGNNTEAYGAASTAMGNYTSARGTGATAMGLYTIANGDNSLVIGRYNRGYTDSIFEIGVGTPGNRSNAMTVYTSGEVSFPLLPNMPCLGTNVSGTLILGSCGGGYRSPIAGGITYMGGNIVTDGFVSKGTGTTANGDYALAMGHGSSANTTGAIAIGVQSISSGYLSVALGFTAEAIGDYSLALGVGLSATNTGSMAIGVQNVSSGIASLAMGRQTQALGDSSTTMGLNTIALGNASIAMGKNTTGAGDYSVAMGFETKASAEGSVAMGYQTQAGDKYSVAMGYNTIMGSENGVAMGKYNIGYKNTLLEIGMGVYGALANALTVRAEGGVKISDSTIDCVGYTYGTIKYSGDNFYGCTAASGRVQLNN